MDPYTAGVTGDDSLPDELGRRGAAPEPIPAPPGGTGGQSGGQSAPPKPPKDWKAIMGDLNVAHARLKLSVPLLTAELRKTGDRRTLEDEKTELETVIANYKKDYNGLDKSKWPEDSRKEWDQQLQKVIKFEDDIKKFFDDLKAIDQLGVGVDDFLGSAAPSGTTNSQDPKTGEEFRFLEGSPGAKVVEILEKEREEHSTAIKRLEGKMDQMRLENERQNQSSHRQIYLLQEKLIAKQPSEISYDEVDMDEVEKQRDIGQEEQATVNFKLDSVQLQTFNGNMTEWESFRDMFEYLVDKSRKISKIMKFQQLRNHLKGTALDCIRGYQLTAKNYDAAWSDLKRRFNRTDELTDEYIRKFIEAPAIRIKPSHLNIRVIVDAANQMLRALPGLNVTVDNWDPFMIFIIKTKVDDETRYEWKQKQVKENLVKVSDLLDFLENKAIELQPTQSGKLSQMMSCEIRKKPHPKVFQVSDPVPEKQLKQSSGCPACDGSHRITDCFKFKKSDAQNRSKLARKLNLCFKCLASHKTGACTRDNCRHCEKPHHPLLCYKKENAAKKQDQPNQNKNPRPQNERPQKYTADQENWDKEDWNQPSTSKNIKN